MGEVDLAVIHPIYRTCVSLTKENNWNFQFKVDSGDYETMIEFATFACRHPPVAKDWDTMKLTGSIPICPDILAWNSKIVLEYEEESKRGKSSGKLGKKGHWAESKRDERRDQLYKLYKFRFCKIWESERKNNMVEQKLFRFLADCHCNRNTDLYQDMFLNGKELIKAISKREKKN